MVTKTQIVNGIHLPIRDTHFAEKVRNGSLMYGKGTYQLDKLLRSVDECRSRRVAVDVGANVGLWTRVLSYYFEEIVAIEPIQENVDCIILNLSDRSNVKVEMLAVGLTRGSLPLSYMENVASANVCDDLSLADAYVNCQPLDDFDLHDVSFIKIDVEGFENNVVKSGKRTIVTNRPVIIVEQKKRTIKYDGYKYAAVQTLCNWGMKVAWEMFGDYCLVWP